MRNADCVAFLRWALPRLDLRWQGFREGPRPSLQAAQTPIKTARHRGFDAYRKRLAADPKEWAAVDELCHITISRFFRDSRVFEALSERVLPKIAARAVADQRPARFWSAGCDVRSTVVSFVHGKPRMNAGSNRLANIVRIIGQVRHVHLEPGSHDSSYRTLTQTHDAGNRAPARRQTACPIFGPANRKG